MKPKNIILLFSLFLIFVIIFSGKINQSDLQKPLTNDDYNFIAINEIMMWVGNNGDGSHDPNTDGSGFYWPGGKISDKTAIFKEGLIWGCKVNGEPIVNGNIWLHALQAGKIRANGAADDPYNPKYRVYRVRKDWTKLLPGPERDSFEKDLYQWPVEHGAPWEDLNGDGVYTPGTDTPEFIGDEVLWYVSNDMDSIRSQKSFGEIPIGLEFQTTLFGFNRTHFLNNVVFKKVLIINKSEQYLDSMYVGNWSDDDLGNPHDDFVGCDTTLSLGYTYNGRNSDEIYGPSPPAVGHMFVQGPTVPASEADTAWFQNKQKSGYKNLPLTSFFLYLSAGPGHPGITTTGYYNNLKGRIWNGYPIVDPKTGLETNFVVPGNPVLDEGWYEGVGWPGGMDPDERRQLISSGPFTMAPGDSQEVTIAILIAQGEDHLDSITKLKNTAQVVQIAYDLNFKVTPEMEKPHQKVVTGHQNLTLYWESNTEDFNQPDPLLPFESVENQNYRFEGYRVWQFRDTSGTEPKLLATFDLENDVDLIYEQQIINGHPATVVAIDGANEGIKRSISISQNAYDQTPLNNANPYYFAVSAYAYSEHSDPAYIESKPQIIEVIPGLRNIDHTVSRESGEKIEAVHISGSGDGFVEILVVDPDALTSNEYHVTFSGDINNLSYSFINHTTNDTLLADCTNFKIDPDAANVYDGFILNLQNTGKDHTKAIDDDQMYALRDILEIKGPGGVDMQNPVDVSENSNSTGAWSVSSYGEFREGIQNININDKIGYQYYEIRFTHTGSDYYLTGSAFGFSPWRADDPKAVDRVPFEIWDLGMTDSNDDDIRLSIKTLDDYSSLLDDSTRVDQDGKWSQLENRKWEPFFGFFQDSVYQEPLPETSGRISDVQNSRLGKFVIQENLPEEGTVIQIRTWKPLSNEDIFVVSTVQANKSDFISARDRLDQISVFPNPYLGFGTLSGYIKQEFVRFTNLPMAATLRIFSLSGVYVRQIEKNDDTPFLDWNLKNNAGETVASGVYIAHLEMPNIGEKVMKLAVILENRR